MIKLFELEQEEGVNKLVLEHSYKYSSKKIGSPLAISDMMKDLFRLDKKAEEYVYLLAMSNAMNCIGVFLISKGTLSYSVLNPREIFSRVLLCASNKIILVHNHPGGSNTPSKDDKEVTERIKQTSNLLGITLLDHIIVGEQYYSFKENGML